MAQKQEAAGKIGAENQISCQQIAGRPTGPSKAKGSWVFGKILGDVMEPEQRDLNLPCTNLSDLSSR